MKIKALFGKIVRYFRIHAGESMGRRFIAFMWGEAKTLIKIRVQVPICLWRLCRWDSDSCGLLNGLHIFYVGWSFRVRDKIFFPLGTNLVIQHFYHGWVSWREKCRFLSLELLEDSGLIFQSIKSSSPREIWDEYYTKKHAVGVVAQ